MLEARTALRPVGGPRAADDTSGAEAAGMPSLLPVC